MLRSRTTALVAALAMLVIAGCGGSTKSTRSTTATSNSQSDAASTTTAPGSGPTPVAKDELISEADSICRRIAARRNSNRANTSQQVGAQAIELATFEHTTAEELASYTPTSDFASDWQKLVAGAEKLAGYTTQIGQYANAGQLKNSEATTAIVARHQLELKMLAIAKRNGMRDCAQSI